MPVDNAAVQQLMSYGLTQVQALQLLQQAKPKAASTQYPAPYTKGDPHNIFIMGDTHAPFIREGYLEWCRQQQEYWNCGTVVHIGDLVDQHAISYHESDPDGLSAGEELEASRQCLQKLFAMFPNAKMTLGNHDLLIARKAKTAGLSSHFIRTIGEVYGAPAGWEIGHEFTIHGIRFKHGGAGGNAERMTLQSRISTVQGHLHTEAGCKWHVSERDALFSLQVGSGVDDTAYAMEYGRPFPKKSVVGAAVILNSGTIPISLLMPL